jgi:predicted dehydrogenase
MPLVGAELKGCRSRAADHRERFARQHGGKAFGSLYELPGDPSVDAVSILSTCVTSGPSRT